MRGLTANERFILRRLAADPPGHIRDCRGEPVDLTEAKRTLVRDGRCERQISPLTGRLTIIDITTKGREALRIDAIANMVLT